MVQSVEQSSLNEDDYYNAAVKAYHASKAKAHIVSLDNDDIVEESYNEQDNKQ